MRDYLLEAPVDSPLFQSVVRVTKDFINQELKREQGWTPTAIELWSDEEFIKKRIEEQFVYGVCLVSEQLSDRCTRSQERFEELLNTSQVVLKRLHDRLQELK